MGLASFRHNEKARVTGVEGAREKNVVNGIRKVRDGG